MTSVANVRDTPYLTSSHVTSEPSSHLTPSRMVNDHSVASSFAVPVSVARSPTTWLASSGSVLNVNWVSARVVYAPKNARSSPV